MTEKTGDYLDSSLQIDGAGTGNSDNDECLLVDFTLYNYSHGLTLMKDWSERKVRS